MSRLPGFTGPSNVTRSVNIDAERTINLVCEVVGAGTPKVQASMYGRPGLTPFLSVAAGPHRACFYQDNRAWVVSGIYFAEVFANQSVTIRGTVAIDGNPATIVSNGGSDGSGGHQLMIISGGLGYVFDLVTNAFTQITDQDFPFPAFQGAYLDNYGIVLKGQSNLFALSNLNDFLVWDALDVAQVSQWPSQISSFIVSHLELWLASQTKTSPWVDSAASFPFQPLPGTVIEHGIAAPWSFNRVDNSLVWLNQTEQGGALAVRVDGYNPRIVCPPAIAFKLQTVTNIQNTISWTCQLEGHTFWVLYIPDNDTSLVYDLSNDSWVEWAHWDTNLIKWVPFVGVTHMFAFGKHLVGDRQSGALYEMSFEIYDDTIIVGSAA